MVVGAECLGRWSPIPQFVEIAHFMTPEQIKLVRQSWDSLWPKWNEFADKVYGRFFEIAPDARRLFADDLGPQKIKLMDTMTVIIGYLDNPSMFGSIISHSGKQHQRFGARIEHYAGFRNALMEGLKLQFGAAFTPELEEAWTALYDEVRQEMIRYAKA
jgi:hemoglobin-like flavoprotein